MFTNMGRREVSEKILYVKRIIKWGLHLPELLCNNFLALVPWRTNKF
jgi:hypothetical protein